MGTGAIIALGFFATMVIIFVGGLMYDFKLKTRKKEEPPPAPPPPASLSLLAGLSFFCGLGAIFLASVTGILTLMLSMDNLFSISDATLRQIQLAAKIVLYVSLLPAVGAVAFALAARGVIAESRDTVRGRPLYRTGILLAVTTAVIVFDAKILNPSTWIRAGNSFASEDRNEDLESGYLGVEPGPLDNTGTLALIRVVPGSPAEKAGLQAGDQVVSVDGRRVFELPPRGAPGFGFSHGTNYLGEYIRSLKPGSKIAIEVRRGGKSHKVEAELWASFDTLLALVKRQFLDEERLAVLKAAGGDRRYSADELRRICGAFDFDDHRMRAIETALPKLQDPQNAYQILGALEYAHSKKKVGDWIEAANKGK